jgi:tripartite-type tricarboxylate transporter receptor subunit TctC
MTLTRRQALAATATLLAMPAHAQGQAQPWPSRPVRLVVGFTAGSSTDVTARLFAQKLTELWGQPVVVENLPGNGGALGVDRVAKSAPDGHTFMWAGNGAVTIVPTLQRVGFDPLRDLVSLGIMLSMPTVILANNNQPFASLGDLIAHARANPGKLSYGTPGAGTPQHIAGEMLCHQAGIRMEHIPYRGANLADVLSGVVPVGLQNAGAAMPLVRDGALRCLGLTTLRRSANAPDIPTVAEQGFPGFEALSWFGLMAPAGTDATIIAKVNADARRVLAEADTRARIAQLGLDPVGGTPAQMHATIAADLPKWAKVMADAGMVTLR